MYIRFGTLQGLKHPVGLWPALPAEMGPLHTCERHPATLGSLLPGM